MATERLLMRHIREILRLKWTLRRSHRDTARSLGIFSLRRTGHSAPHTSQHHFTCGQSRKSSGWSVS
jgi:hypothetical protein